MILQRTVPLLILVVFLVVSGCDKKALKEVSLHDELVRNVIMTSAFYPCYDCKSKDDDEFKAAIEKALSKVTEIQDDSLELKMSLHFFSNGISGTAPHSIIYMEIKDSLKYAFSFNDEANYLDQSFLIKDQAIRRMVDERSQLQNQLNMAAARLHINRLGSERRLEKFINLFFQSLLHCETVNDQIGDTLKMSMQKTIHLLDGPAYDSCLLNYQSNFLRIKSEILSGAARYFTTHKGLNGLWRVQIDTSDNLLIIRSSLENYQCYTSASL